MKNIQKMGAFASLAFGISFIVLVGLLITIASLGYVPGSGNEPAKALEFAGGSLLPYIIYLLYALFGILFVVIVLAMKERLKDKSPILMQLAMIAAVITSALFLTYAMLGYVGEPMLVTVYRQDAVAGSTAYLAMRVVSNALNSAAIFAAGWAILLTGWAALYAMDFPKALVILLMMAGGSSILAFLLPIFGMFAPLFYIMWSIWLGIFMLRSSSAPFNNGGLD